jgi:hypothetical protein
VLLAILLFIKRHPRLSLLPFLAGLLTYELAVVTPLLILFMIPRRRWREHALEIIPHFTVAAVYVILHKLYLTQAGGTELTVAQLVTIPRYVFQLFFPFLDSPRFAFYNVALKEFVKSHLPICASISMLVVVSGCFTVWVFRRRLLAPGAGSLAILFFTALLPAMLYGKYSPRVAYLASVFPPIYLFLVLRGVKGMRVWFWLYFLLLTAACFDENRYWHIGGQIALETLERDAGGEEVTITRGYRKLVPIFSTDKCFECARSFYRRHGGKSIGDNHPPGSTGTVPKYGNLDSLSVTQGSLSAYSSV